MQKKYWIIPGIIVVLMVAALIALSNTYTVSAEKKPVCCKKNAVQCAPSIEKPASEQPGLDHLSSQFINISLFSH